MLKKLNLHLLLILTFIFTATTSIARDYMIFSIVQEVPMGIDNEVTKKNYYINMGKNQGLKNGTVLDVYRNVSILDPYKSKARHQYRVPVGQLKVIHTEDTVAISSLVKNFAKEKEKPLFEISKLMIGDEVEIHVKN